MITNNNDEAFKIAFEMLEAQKEYISKDILSVKNQSAYDLTINRILLTSEINEVDTFKQWKFFANVERLELREKYNEPALFSTIDPKKYVNLAHKHFLEILESVETRFIRGLQ